MEGNESVLRKGCCVGYGLGMTDIDRHRVAVDV